MLEQKTKVREYSDILKERGESKIGKSYDYLALADPRQYYYSKLKDEDSKYLNEAYYHQAAAKGEADDYINLALMNQSNETGNAKFDELVKYGGRVDYDTYMYAMQYPFLDNETKKDRGVDAQGNTLSYTDKEWADQILTYTREKYDAEIAQEAKDATDTFWSFLKEMPARVVSYASKVVSGTMRAIQDTYNLFEGIGNLITGKSFLEAFADDDSEWLAQAQNALDEAIFEWQRDNTHLVDYNSETGQYEYSTWGNWMNGMYDSIGYMLPSMLVGLATGGASSALTSAGGMAAKTAGVALTAGREALQTGFFYSYIFSGMVKENVTLALSENSNLTVKDLNAGTIVSNAALKATAQWAVEYALGKLIGVTTQTFMTTGQTGSGLLGKSIEATKAATDASARGWAAFGKRMATVGKEAAQEGLEEVLQDSSDKLIDYMYGGGYRERSEEITAGSLLDSFIVGAMTSVATGAVHDARVVIDTKKSGTNFAYDTSGKAYEMGAFQVLNTAESMNLVQEWVKTAQDTSVSNEERIDAYFKVNAFASTMGNVFKTLGFNRSFQALSRAEAINTMQSTKADFDGIFSKTDARTSVMDAIRSTTETREQTQAAKESEFVSRLSNKVNELMNKLTVGRVVAGEQYKQTKETERLQRQLEKAKRKVDKAIQVSEDKLKQGGVSDINSIVTEEAVAQSGTDDVPKDLQKALKQIGAEVLVGHDGRVVTRSGDVIFVPDSVIKSGKLGPILEGISYEAAITQFSTAMTKSQTQLVHDQYRQLTNNDKASVEEAITALLFDRDFYCYMLFKYKETGNPKTLTNNKALGLMATMDKVVKGALANETVQGRLAQKAYETLMNKIRENMRTGLITFATQYFYIDFNTVSKEVISTEDIDAIKTVVQNHKNVQFTDKLNRIKDNKATVVDSTWYDQQIDVYSSLIGETLAAQLKRNARSSNYNDRVTASATLNYLNAAFGTKDKAVYLPIYNKQNVEMKNAQLACDKVANNFGIKWDGIAKAKISEMSPAIVQKAKEAGYDLSIPQQRFAFVREEVYETSGHQYTIGTNYVVLQVLDSKNFYTGEVFKSASEDADYDSIINEGIARGRIKTVSDLCPQVDPRVGTIKIKIDKKLTSKNANGRYDVNNKIIYLSGENTSNTILHEITHVTQDLVNSGAGLDFQIKGGQLTMFKGMDIKSRQSLFEYLQQTFPEFSQIVSSLQFDENANINEIGATVAYLLLEGELEAYSTASANLNSLGFTISNDGKTLFSPDGKEKWTLKAPKNPMAINLDNVVPTRVLSDKSVAEIVNSKTMTSAFKTNSILQNVAKNTLPVLRARSGNPMVIFRYGNGTDLNFNTDYNGVLSLDRSRMGSSAAIYTSLFAENRADPLLNFNAFVLNNLSPKDVLVIDAKGIYTSENSATQYLADFYGKLSADQKLTKSNAALARILISNFDTMLNDARVDSTGNLILQDSSFVDEDKRGFEELSQITFKFSRTQILPLLEAFEMAYSDYLASNGDIYSGQNASFDALVKAFAPIAKILSENVDKVASEYLNRLVERANIDLLENNINDVKKVIVFKDIHTASTSISQSGPGMETHVSLMPGIETSNLIMLGTSTPASDRQIYDAARTTVDKEITRLNSVIETLIRTKPEFKALYDHNQTIDNILRTLDLDDPSRLELQNELIANDNKLQEMLSRETSSSSSRGELFARELGQDLDNMYSIQFRKDKQRGSRLLTKKEATGSNLENFLQTGVQIQLHSGVRDFVKNTTTDFKSLPKVLRDLIAPADGSRADLTIDDLIEYTATTKTMNDYTYKHLAKDAFNNEEAAKLSYKDMKSIRQDIQELATVAEFLRMSKSDKLKAGYTKKYSVAELIKLKDNVLKKLKAAEYSTDKSAQAMEKAYQRALDTATQVVTEISGKGTRKYSDPITGYEDMLNVLFMRYYNGTFESIRQINNHGKMIMYKLQEGIKGSQLSGEKKNGEGHEKARQTAANALSNWVEKVRRAEVDYGDAVVDGNTEYAQEAINDVDIQDKRNLIEEHLEAEYAKALNALVDEKGGDREALKAEGLKLLNEHNKALSKLDAMSDAEINDEYAQLVTAETIGAIPTVGDKFERPAVLRWGKKGRTRTTVKTAKYASTATRTNTLTQTATKTTQLAGTTTKAAFKNYPAEIRENFDYTEKRTLKLNDNYKSMSETEKEAFIDSLKEFNKRLRATKNLTEAQMGLRKETRETKRYIKEMTEKYKKEKGIETKGVGPNGKEVDLSKPKTMRQKVRTEYVVNIKNADLDIKTNYAMTDTAKQLMATQWSKQRMSAVQGLSTNESRNVSSAKDFFTQNAETLSKMTAAEAEATAEWFMTATVMNVTEDVDAYKIFEANRVMFLGYLYSETKAGKAFENLSPNLKQRIETYLGALTSIGATRMAIWNAIQDRVNPAEVMMAAMRLGDSKLTDQEQQALIKATNNNDMDEVTRIQEQILDRVKNEKISKKGLAKNITAIRAMGMLSSPMTWLRNKVSNVMLKNLNKVSSKIGNAIAPNRTNAGQLKMLQGVKVDQKTGKIIGGDITPEIQKFINDNFIDNKLYDTLLKDISKYNPSDIRQKYKNADGTVEKSAVFADMVLKSLYAQYYNANIFKSKTMNKTYSFIMKMLSDNNYVREAAVRYFGKILGDRSYDLSKGVTDNVMNDFASAVGLAMSDYMHSDNFLNQIERVIAEKGDVAYTAYKLILPFASSGWNWFRAAMRYSPIGLAQSIVKLARLEQSIIKAEAEFAVGKSQVAPELTEYTIRRDLGSGIIGTMALLAGMALAGLGFIKLDDDDYGVPKLSIGSIEVDVSDIFGSSSLLVGAGLVKGIMDGDGWDGWLDGFNNALDVALDGFFLTDLMALDLYGNGMFDTLKNLTESVILSFIPNIVSYAAGATYGGTKKKTKFWQKLVAKIPFLANILPDKVDPYTGKSGGVLDILNRVLPYLDINVKSNQQKIAESLGLSKSELTGKYAINDEDFTLSAKETAELNKLYGGWNAEYITKFLNDQTRMSVKDESSGKYVKLKYSQMTEKQRKNALTTIMNNNATYAKIYAWIKAGNTYYASDTDYAALTERGISVYRGNKGFVKK